MDYSIRHSSPHPKFFRGGCPGKVLKFRGGGIRGTISLLILLMLLITSATTSTTSTTTSSSSTSTSTTN